MAGVYGGYWVSDLFGDDEGGQFYSVAIDKRWQLDDLTLFSKAYEESYFSLYGLYSVVSDGTDSSIVQGRINRAFRSYPWLGGYSALNFFRELKFSVPKKRRPTIVKIQYASPGVIDLLLDQHIAIQIGAVVTSICGSIKLVNSTYHGIYKGYVDRRLAKISVEKAEMELEKEQLAFISESNRKLAEILNVPSVEALNDATGHPLRSMKIMMAVFRRVHKLAKMQGSGKIKLPQND